MHGNTEHRRQLDAEVNDFLEQQANPLHPVIRTIAATINSDAVYGPEIVMVEIVEYEPA